jgi:Fe-S-cluster containining protein
MNADTDDAWFKKGLKFSCTQCGSCCTGETGYVWISKEETAALAKELKLSEKEFKKRYTYKVWGKRSLVEKENNDCVFWKKEGGCAVYEARPMQCRTWPFWDSNLKTPKHWERTATDCPGCNQGKKHSKESIQEEAKKARETMGW